MKKSPIYEPTLRDRHPRDLLARAITLCLWVLVLMSVGGFSRQGISLIGPDDGVQNPRFTASLIAHMTRLMGVAYMISVGFFAWRFLTEIMRPTEETNPPNLDLDGVANTFGVSRDHLVEIQRATHQRLCISSTGTIEPADQPKESP
jgi:hypothetical protein